MSKIIIHFPDGTTKTIMTQLAPMNVQMTVTASLAIAEIRDSNGGIVAVLDLAPGEWLESDLQSFPNA